jgi:hypothetical protein
MSFIPNDFKIFIDKFKDNYRSIDLRLIAMPSDLGWQFHLVKIVLDADSKDNPINKDIPNIENLLIKHERLDISKIDELFDNIKKGELILGDYKIHIKISEGNNWRPLQNLYYRFFEKTESNSRFSINYPSGILQEFHGPQFDHNLRKIIEHKLRSGIKPWDGLKDLRKNFFGFSENLSSMDNSFLHIIAPIYLKLEKIKIDENKIEVDINKADTINYEEISLSIITYQKDDRITRLKYPLKNSNAKIELDALPIKVKILLNYRDYVADFKELFGYTLNKRINIYQQLIGDIQEFTTDLNEKGRQFEAKISLLFHLLGFSPAYYGYGSGDVPDILVFNESDEFVILIECTTREPDINNKLTKLATRTKEVKRALLDVRVLPILVTALERNLISNSNEEKTRKEQIIIITIDELSTLVTMGLEQRSTESIYDYLNTLINWIPFAA